jgi:hypothetical protein
VALLKAVDRLEDSGDFFSSPSYLQLRRQELEDRQLERQWESQRSDMMMMMTMMMMAFMRSQGMQMPLVPLLSPQQLLQPPSQLASQTPSQSVPQPSPPALLRVCLCVVYVIHTHQLKITYHKVNGQYEKAATVVIR